MARVLILIGAHLCTAPRPQKEAETLAKAGHDVSVRGFWFDPLHAERDLALAQGRRWQFRPLIDFRPVSLAGRGRSFAVRAFHRMARELQMRFGTFSPAVLGYGVGAMFKTALAENADLSIVHSEAGLWVGGRLLDKGLRVGVDFEDWFSEDLLPEARKARPVALIKSFEQRLMRECSYRLTTSNVLASALSETYDAPTPAVVYNTFPFAERENIDGQIRDRRNPTIPSLHWFSQTIGPGRGLEMLFGSLRYVTYPVEIHVRGNHSEETRRWINTLLPQGWADRVFIHKTVGNTELISRIHEHDIGLALEMPYCLSRQLTITNKLFQYLQAGLAIIATNTPGQREVLERCPDAGMLVSGDDPRAIADAIESLAKDKERLAMAKSASLIAAKAMFCWEVEEENLLRESEKALKESSARSVGRAAASLSR